MGSWGPGFFQLDGTHEHNNLLGFWGIRIFRGGDNILYIPPPKGRQGVGVTTPSVLSSALLTHRTTR